MLKIDKLVKNYKKTKAVQGINIELKDGEIFGFIGPNGAGKSTTIRCIMNLINKNSGLIKLNDEELDRNNKNFKFLKNEIGYLPSEIHLYDDLTVQEMLDYSASFYQKDCKEKTKYLVKRLKIQTNKKIDELSFGNLKKVGIVLALMHDPKFIILDEPTNGLDPLMQEEFYQLLFEEQKNGKTIFFSTHILSEINRICERVGIIKDGKIIKVEDVDKSNENSILIVTIKSKDIKQIKKELELKEIESKNNLSKFICEKDINYLINNLSKYKIDKLLIEEPSIQDVFMHYYR